MLDQLKLTQLIIEYHEQHKATDWPMVLEIEQVPLPHVIHFPYHLVATDGSQIYPDRHEGVLAYLVHTAAIIYDYRSQDSIFSVVSKPEIYSGVLEDGAAVTAQQVDDQRTCAEYQLLTEHAREYALIDGNLEQPLEELPGVIYAGYVSKPRARDLVRKFGLKTPLCDAELLEPVLLSGHRTQFHHSPQFNCYYAYVRLGARPLMVSVVESRRPQSYEIARIEVPEHIAQDSLKTEALMRMVVDQCTKGDGYPLALAQAHEAAVVTAQDRAFFYDMLRAQDVSLQRSLKLRKKLEVV